MLLFLQKKKNPAPGTSGTGFGMAAPGEIAVEAEVIGRGLEVPVRAIPPEAASAHFGWLGMFVGVDMPASSAKTRALLGWEPTGPDLLSDLGQMRFVNP